MASPTASTGRDGGSDRSASCPFGNRIHWRLCKVAGGARKRSTDRHPAQRLYGAVDSASKRRGGVEVMMKIVSELSSLVQLFSCAVFLGPSICKAT